MKPLSIRLSGRLALIALLAVVPALLAIGYLQSIESERARERTLAENLRLARLAASSEASLLEETRRLLLTLAELHSPIGSDARTCHDLLPGVLRTHDQLTNLAVVDLDGVLVCSALPIEPKLARNTRGLEWFDRAVQTRSTAIGEPQRSATAEELAIVVAHPVLDASGVVTHVIAASITLSQLNRTAAQAHLPPGTTLTVFNHARTILARYPVSGAWIGKQMPDSAVAQRLAGGARQDLREGPGVDGVLRLYATVPLDLSFNARLYLGLGVDHATAFAERGRVMRQYLWLLAVVLVGALGAAFIGGRTFVLKPVKQLRDVADRLAKGDLSARAQLAGGVAGLGELAEAVNSMAAALDERQRERDEAELAYREAEERRRFALQAADVGVWDLRLESGEVRWSETCEIMHGLAPGQFGGTLENVVAAVHPEDREIVSRAMTLAVTTQADPNVEYRTIWPDGSVHRISARGRLMFDAEGNAVRGAGVVLDVTEKRLLEEQLRQSLKMEAVGQLAGGIAHDFNNLLTIITGNTQLAREMLPDGSTAHEDLDHALVAAERAAQLTRQLLAFSRKQVLRTEQVDISKLVEEITPIVRRLVGEDVAVTTKSIGADAITIADRAELEQALINLVINSRDAMPGGGALHIVTKAMHLDAMAIGRQRLDLDPGEYVELRLTDTGAGMTPEVLARAFEPFFTTKGVGKGTGLGLPSAYGTVKQFGGHMDIESAVGRGTTITILLPRVAAVEPAKAAQAAEPDATAGGTVTILLVEDEAALRHLTARVLSGAGYSVLQASGGDEALECARQHPGEIHLVLSDVVMPGMSALDLMAGLREARPRAATLLMSGYPRDEILRRGVRSQDFTLLEKPFTAEALRTRVHVVLSEHARKSVGVAS